jgi:hypothetical protein
MSLRAHLDLVKAGFIPCNTHGDVAGATGALLVGGEGIEPPTSSV